MNRFFAVKLLQLKSLGTIKLKNLIDIFGDCEKIVNADEDELMTKTRLSKDIIKKIQGVKNDLFIDEFFNELERNNTKMTVYGEENFPEVFKHIFSAPCVLYYKGNFLASDYNSVSVVGSRVPVNYAKKTAINIVDDLSKAGITIISGLARGIDTIAHRTALKNNTRTIAVLGSGVNNIYPFENTKLADEIAEKGVLLSEYPLNKKPFPNHFPFRNRLISALSLATVVIQAAKKSGSLITAYFALEQGKDIFAVPYELGCKYGEGCNNLIKQGAYLIQSAEDVIENVNFDRKFFIDKTRNLEKKIITLTPDEKSFVEFLEEKKSIDQIINNFNKTMSEITIILLKLEMKNVIKKLPGNCFEKV